MSEPLRDSDNTYITTRYERWRNMAVPFDYKRTKGERIAAILQESGGLPRRALEVGVGPGAIAGLLSQRGIRMIGMDLSPDALFRAKEHCRDKDVSLLRGSGFALPFASGSLPTVYASQVLHLFDNEGRLGLMREVHRVLQPGGRFVFDMKNVVTHAFRYLTSTAKRKRRNFPRLRELDELLGQAGFMDVERRPGLLPGLRMTNVPNLSLTRAIAHTVFFVARKR